MKKLIPTKKQWKTWHLPNKLTVISVYAGVIGILLTIVFFCINQFQKNPHLVQGNYPFDDFSPDEYEKITQLYELILIDLDSLYQQLSNYSIEQKPQYNADLNP